MNQQMKNVISGRTGSDIFQTPEYGVKPLFPHIPLNWTIWEPACGEGQLVTAIEDAGYSVIGTDVLHGFDFLAPLATCEFGYDCIVTNPPYSQKDKWIERCFETGKPFALLLPLTALGENCRIKIYEKHEVPQIILPQKRIHFGTPTGKESNNWFYTAWFTHGLDLPRDIIIEEAE